MDELLADAMSLVFCIDSEVCKVSNIGEVRERARNTHQAFTVPRCNSEIGMIEHTLEYVRPIYGPSLTESRSFIEVDSGLNGNLGVVTVCDLHAERAQVWGG